MVAGGCYLLLTAIILLFAVGGTAVRGGVLRLPTSTTTASLLTQASTRRAGQAADEATVTASPNVPPLSADMVNGRRLFSTFQPTAGIACSTCHRVDSEERLVGPGLLNVARRAGATVKGMDVVDYLRESIVNPGAYVVAGYADIMPRNWGRIFSRKQIDDLIAYLLTLRSG
jgi:cytochrome c2